MDPTLEALFAYILQILQFRTGEHYKRTRKKDMQTKSVYSPLQSK